MRETVKKYRFLLLGISGIVLALTLIFPVIGALEWVALIPAALVFITISQDEGVKLKSIYLSGLVFFFCFYLVSYHWFLYMYPLEFMDIPKATAALVVAVAWIGLPIIQALMGGLMVLTLAFVVRCKMLQKLKILTPFFAAVLWSVYEWSQTIGWWGIPWCRLALGQTDTGLTLLSASLFGSYFITFLIVAVNFCIAYLLLHESAVKCMSAACVCMIIGNLALGGAVRLSYSNDEEKSITVAGIQSNVDLSEKWGSEFYDVTKRLQTKYTLEAAEKGAELIFWAETVFPCDINTSLAEYMSDLALEADATIIASSFTLPEEKIYSDRGICRSYNSLYEVRSDGSFGDDLYSKQMLVPFAEFVPLRELVTLIIPPLAELNMLPDDLLRGEESSVLNTEKGKVGCAICFDSVYERITLEAVRGGAEIIVVATNDAWFDDSAEVRMHTAQARLRAIETGRFIVRSANTGISAIISPLGEVVDELSPNTEGYVIADVYMRDSRTVYSVIGNLFVYTCAVAVLAAFGVAVIDKIRSRNKENEK